MRKISAGGLQRSDLDRFAVSSGMVMLTVEYKLDSTDLRLSGLEAFTFDYVVKWPVSLVISRKVRLLDSLSLRFNSHFSRLAIFLAAKDDGSGGDRWSYKSCKAPVKSSPPTNQHPMFYMPYALPVAQPTVSKH